MDPCGRGEGTPSRFARRWRRARRLGTRRLGQARRLDPDRSGMCPRRVWIGVGRARGCRLPGAPLAPAARLRRPRGAGYECEPGRRGRPARVGSARVRPFAAAAYGREGRPRRLGGREIASRSTFCGPFPQRANASNPPPPRRLRRASGAGSRPPRRDPRPRRVRTLPSPKRPAQPTGRRHTPHQNPMKAAVFGLGPRRDGVALSDPRHPGSSGTAHPSKSRANVRPV
jgi:hypothetical protein